MPKIKTQPISLNPRTPSISIADPSPRQGSVRRATPQREFDSGKGILADILDDVGGAAHSFAKYRAIKDKELLKTESSDYLADLANFYNGRYINDIAVKKSGSAKDVFKQEIALTQEGKEVFLERAGENKRLRDLLSIGYDSVTQNYLQKVSKHKLLQDEVYIKDTTYKVAKVLQTEMTNLRIEESGKAVAISEQINSQLKDQPVLREAMKINAWQGYYKFNARVNPDQTQEVYENPAVRKSIVNQIGFSGYSSIQEAIDTGRRIKLQNEQLSKIRAAEKKDEDVETVMGGAVSTYLKKPEKFTADLIDSLKLSTGENLPSQEKRILIGFLSSLASGKTLTDAEVDYSIYAELLEDVRWGKSSGLKIRGIQNDIIKEMNRTITNNQGSSLLKALSNRDIFDKPTVSAAFDKLANMYKEDGVFSHVEYTKVVHGLSETVIRYDGDTKKIQEFMQDVLEPAARKGSLRRVFEAVTPNAMVMEKPELEGQEPIMPYMSEQEKEDINTLLFDAGQTATVYDLTDEGIIKYLDYIRSPQYITDQNVKAKTKTKPKAKAKPEDLTDIMQ